MHGYAFQSIEGSQRGERATDGGMQGGANPFVSLTPPDRAAAQWVNRQTEFIRDIIIIFSSLKLMAISIAGSYGRFSKKKPPTFYIKA